MQVKNADLTEPDGEAGQAKKGRRQNEAMYHGANTRAKRVESTERRNAIGGGLLCRREFVPELRAQCPLPSQRHEAVHQQPQGSRFSQTLVEDRKHLVCKSSTEAGWMQTKHAAV
jgi:hypothetical protein